MKKLLGISLAVFLLFTGSRALAEDNAIRVVDAWPNTNLLINTTNTSPAIDLWQYKPMAFDFSAQLLVTNAVTNSGSVVLSAEYSNNGVDFFSSTGIVSGFSFTNSPSADGKTLIPFSSGVARYLRFKAVTTLTNANLTMWLFIQ